MLRKVISIPEGVYYRGRFRATIVWSKVSRRGGEDNAATVDEERPCSIDELEGALRQRVISGKTKMSDLNVRPARS
jgi:hypothetical protein